MRLVLPHQLFEQQWQVPDDTVFVMVEHDLFFRQYRFHAHKLVLHRASMDRFARRLRSRGHRVHTVRSVPDRSSAEQLTALISALEPAEISCFEVVDDWLEQDLVSALAGAGHAMRSRDFLNTPNFLTGVGELETWFRSRPARMQDFYTWQRRRLDLLIDDDGGPVGGKWSFDAENRKPLPRGYVPPPLSRFGGHPAAPGNGFDLESLSTGDIEAPQRNEDLERAIAWVQETFPDAPGDPAGFCWPTDAEEARADLAEFIRERLADFGPYEDAMSARYAFVNHAALTPSLNIGLLSPHQIIHAVMTEADDDVPLASLEGFVRQVIGWREYMRASYHTRGRRLRISNHLGHRNELGAGWWDGTTGLEPVDLVIRRVLNTGYAHHIERLMVLGNAMTLLRIHPDAAYAWFMEMFVDAYDWVMVPNVYAMSQFAAGDEITTKPYVSGSNYLRTMSDLPAGPWCAHWDALYWAFVCDHQEVLARHHRAKLIPALWHRMDAEKRSAHLTRAETLLDGSHPRLVVPATQSR